jgi:tetratricopeptide (TPR) repeat protein
VSTPITIEFPSEANWPFLLREDLLRDALNFLEDDDVDTCCHLQLMGDSGVGKSFFVRELICKYASRLYGGAAIYIDVPQPELEAGDSLRQLASALSMVQFARRTSPIHVPTSICEAWRNRRLPRQNSRRDELYARLRELLGVVPEPGKYLKALLPANLSGAQQLGSEPLHALRFLAERSKQQPILIAIDNIQFMPTSMRDSIAEELLAVGKYFRLITVERTIEGRGKNWDLNLARFVTRPLVLSPANKEDVSTLIRKVLPDGSDMAEIVESVYRRSAGNLKSTWYQLRLIAERRTAQGVLGPSKSYQDVIDSLHPQDQLVLRFVVFLLGRITVNSLADICRAANLGIQNGDVFTAVEDLAKLGLVIINGENKDRVRPEHEFVSTLVRDLTSEEEQQELQAQLVDALSQMLQRPVADDYDEILYDRLVGIVHEGNVRSSQAVLTHLVNFVYMQKRRERFGYLADLLETSTYQHILDLLPEDTIRILLDALQKTSRFSLGLIIAQRLQRESHMRQLGALYAAKYLVQLFRYDEAEAELAKAGTSEEATSIAFTISLNLCRDDDAARLTEATYASLSKTLARSEFALIILRNSGHLFPAERSREILNFASRAFHRQGKQFGTATCINNLGLVELAAGNFNEARAHLTLAYQMLQELESPEAYQPLVNLSVLECCQGQMATALDRLRQARSLAPVTLAMDKAMLDFNQAVLQLLNSELVPTQTLPQLLAIQRAAAQTHDLRFVEVVTRFIGELQVCCYGFREVPEPEQAFTEIFRSTRSPLELYFPLQIEQNMIQAPLVLSPHWRY